jgi:hypothetical protein
MRLRGPRTQIESPIRQILLGVTAALVAVALATFVVRITDFRIGNGSAAARSAQVAAPLATASGDVSDGFSALHDSSVVAAPPTVVEDFKSMHAGTYADAKALQDGMYLATNNGSLCGWIVDGFGQCTEQLNYGDVWLEGDERRHYDSPSAPFDVHLYGFARDGITAIRVTVKGSTESLPVTNNAFRGTIGNASFSDIESVERVYESGKATVMHTSNQLSGLPGAP